MNDLSCCFITPRAADCVAFYKKYLEAKVHFDSGWYFNMTLMNGPFSLQFMIPREEQSSFSGAGIMINLDVNDVDAEYERLRKLEAPVGPPPEDHPWGDRGFGFSDPIGNTLYIFQEIEPSSEYRKYYKG